MNPINNQSTRLVSLKDEIKQKLREDIISNTLKPGQRIVETEIAKIMVLVRFLSVKR
ncbi:GntR family transcriptional regulator [Paenibacillus sp. JMULE4]|nr:GntR family transcriptional regulator [Paenibacillus sp. JMULE4]